VHNKTGLYHIKAHLNAARNTKACCCYALQGEFAPNTRLHSAVRLFEGKVPGAGEQQQQQQQQQ
jgi:hypothetical protein